jgi:hypothetical protein
MPDSDMARHVRCGLPDPRRFFEHSLTQESEFYETTSQLAGHAQ